MSITRASFFTRLRTWVLIAGLTALLIAIGLLIGGPFLYAMLIFAVGLNLFGYWFSDKVALKASRARPLPQDEAPELYRVVEELTGKAGVPMPRIYLVPSDQPNAFATGRNPKHAALAVTQGLLKAMPMDQIRGVLAHEIGHIRNRDILVSSIAAMIAAAISSIGSFFFWFAPFFGEDDNNPIAAIGSLLLILIAPIAAMLLQLGVSRQRELLADATGAEILGEGRPLAEALETLERGVQAVPMEVNPATASLYIVHPFRGKGVANLFSTHPPLEERIRRLKEYDAARGLHYA
jgi:heat shock protein HtpX